MTARAFPRTSWNGCSSRSSAASRAEAARPAASASGCRSRAIFPRAWRRRILANRPAGGLQAVVALPVWVGRRSRSL